MKTKEIDIVNGKHIYLVDKGHEVEWAVTDWACDENLNRYGQANGRTFHTLVEAVEYAKQTNDYYALIVRLDVVGDGEERCSFYVFHSFDEALAKAKEVISYEGLPLGLYHELEEHWEAEYGDFGCLQIESYDLGDKLN